MRRETRHFIQLRSVQYVPLLLIELAVAHELAAQQLHRSTTPSPFRDPPLTPPSPYPSHSQISEQEGKDLAAQLQCAWVETSARHNANVGELQLSISIRTLRAWSWLWRPVRLLIET